MKLQYFATILACFCQLTFAQGLPDKPVTAQSLTDSALADFRAPLQATVTLEAVSERPAPAHSFTSATNHFDDLNAVNFFHGGFEPMAFRPKFRAAATHPRHVLLDLDHAQAIAQGFFDGARVRVYQPVNGKLTKIRDAQVKPGGHYASGWKPYRGQRNTVAGETSYKIAFDSSFQPNRTFWFTARTVDIYGRESANSNIVSARSPRETSGQKMAQQPARFTRFKENPPENHPIPAAPGNLRLVSQEDTITLTWDAASGENISGYRIYVTGYNPAEHRGFGLELESDGPVPSQPVQERDIVFVDNFRTTLNQSDLAPFATWPAHRRKISSPFEKVHYQAPYGMWSDASDGYPATWKFVPHPGPIPDAMTGRGETCLQWTVESEAMTGFPLTQYGSPTNAWYPVLKPEVYTVEAWVKGSGSLGIAFEGPYGPAGLELPFGLTNRGNSGIAIDPIQLPVSDSWRKVTGSFTVPRTFEEGLGSILLTFKGPGQLYIDNLRIFQADHPYGEYDPLTHKRIHDMDIRYMRTHELIKTTWGYSLSSMTNNALGNSYAGGRLLSQTFFTLLNNLRKAGNVSPWLQVEMCLAEEEWTGFAEWLCAPYNPAAGDTPKSKPWAWKRWSMGQKEPWIDVFPEFAFEVANETWNQTFAPYDWDWGTPLTDGANGRNYSYGETYGLFNEYVIEQLRASPYWNERVEAKMRYMLCGWQAAPAFGAGAATFSPSSDLLTYAAYISTDGLGDKTVADDFKRFYLMQWAISAVRGQSARNRETEDMLLANGRSIESGIYEYGLGFRVMPNEPPAAKEVDQILFRSMIGAVATLDAGLSRFEYGMTDQAFFTFGHRIGSWGSHTTINFGGHAYPFTKALDLYNEFGTGHFLKTKVQSVPSWDFPAYEAEDNMHKARRDARPDAPLVSIYASAKDDRVTVFLISRKIDNFPIAGDDGVTPAILHLPFRKADRITVHRLAGDPRTDDRFAEQVRRQSFNLPAGAFNGTITVNRASGGTDGGIPPACILAYVFEGVDLSQLRIPPRARFDAPNNAVAGHPVQFSNRTHDARPRWKLGSAGTSTESSPSVTFEQGGFEAIELQVTASNGLTDTLVLPNFPVSVDFKGIRWQPHTLPGNQARHIKASSTHETLHITGSMPLQANAFSPLFRTENPIHTDFIFEATLEAIEASASDNLALGGIALMALPKQGLGFGLHEFERPSLEASLLIRPNGTVHQLTGRGQQTARLQGIGRVQLPARLRLTVNETKATAAIETNGTWQQLATFDVPGDTGLYPVVTTAGRQTTQSSWSNLSLRQSN